MINPWVVRCSTQKKAGTKADCLEFPTAGSLAQKKDNCRPLESVYNMRNLLCIHPVRCLSKINILNKKRKISDGTESNEM